MRIKTLLVANRGEIARRVIATCRKLGVRTVAVFAADDATSPHVTDADVAVQLTGDRGYLDGAALIDAAVRSGADAVHPGYGFLAESPSFADMVLAAGLAFIGPTPETMRLGGDKIAARERVATTGVPVLPGGILPTSLRDLAAMPDFPIVVKAAAGGGGRGMRLVAAAAGLPAAVAAAAQEAESAFGDGRLYWERYLAHARHVEVQVLGDRYGSIVHLGDRECSIQRRHQKLIEEAPSPSLDEALRERILDAAVQCGSAMEYTGAGTVEFLVDGDDRFFFIELNARLQVEHPVTEQVTGLDIVELQLRIAQGDPLPSQSELPAPTGHSIEARIYAEDVAGGFLPQTGTIDSLVLPGTPDVRVDSGVVAGAFIGHQYDGLLMKLISGGDTRDVAITRLRRALRDLRIHGVATTAQLLAAVLDSDDYRRARVTTGWLEDHLESMLPAPDSATIARHAIAAALVLQRHRRLNTKVMASLPTGWRNVPTAPQRQAFSHGDATIVADYALAGDRLRAASGRTTLDGIVLELDANSVAVLSDGFRHSWQVVRCGDRVYVDDDRGTTTFGLVSRFRPPAVVARQGTLTAPLPGRVVAIDVGEGHSVVAGQPLVRIEAMKLEHIVAAPVAGTVVSIATNVGDQVTAAMPLLEINPAD